MLEGCPRRVRRGIRLREGPARFDRSLAAAPADRARHGRVRAQRKPGQPPRFLRGRPPVRRRRHAGRAGSRRQARAVSCPGSHQGARGESREAEPGGIVMATDFTLPELGENIAAGDVLRVLVKAGDVLAKDQPVLELETDKATIEVPSSVAGQVREIKVKAGDKVKVGQAILSVESGGGAAAPAAPAAPPAAAKVE